MALTPESVSGIAGIVAALQLPGVCACLLVGFSGFLRTYERFSLAVGSVTFAGQAAASALNNTKSLARAWQGHTLSEALAIKSAVAVNGSNVHAKERRVLICSLVCRHNFSRTLRS